ncbi:hypothetical protein TSIB_0377 [Thermococcus sibiricus MM 739]|uniref:Uncharacterized protein n=1 Tax=Thermococcus sibiricus (strain DSM 12597 / MM 739) TaxID=604354 RepID=C6A1E8_THESM|nr:hypothetical protein TSIB_0377 [Thermococcus sibiricus MM 739]
MVIITFIVSPLGNIESQHKNLKFIPHIKIAEFFKIFSPSAYY